MIGVHLIFFIIIIHESKKSFPLHNLEDLFIDSNIFVIFVMIINILQCQTYIILNKYVIYFNINWYFLI